QYDIVAGFARLRLGQADAGNFRVGEGRGGDRLVIHLFVVASDDARRDQPLVCGHVGEQDASDDVANGVHALDVRAQLIVDVDVAAPVGLDAGRLEVQVERVRSTRDDTTDVAGVDGR